MEHLLQGETERLLSFLQHPKLDLREHLVLVRFLKAFRQKASLFLECPCCQEPHRGQHRTTPGSSPCCALGPDAVLRTSAREPMIVFDQQILSFPKFKVRLDRTICEVFQRQPWTWRGALHISTVFSLLINVNARAFLARGPRSCEKV